MKDAKLNAAAQGTLFEDSDGANYPPPPPSTRNGNFKCEKICLEGGTGEHDREFLDVAPTMRTITHKGRKFFRCPRSCVFDKSDGRWGMMYLWDGWGEWMLQQKKVQHPTPATAEGAKR